MRIRTRNDLIKFIEDNAPTKSILRAVLNHNENLGGFYRLPVNRTGGWIVRVTSKFNKQWLLAINFDDRTYSRYKVWIIAAIPWKYWDGDSSENPLYQGDYPEKYKEKRNGTT